MNAALEGTGVALVTPFTKDLEIDYAGLEKLLQHTAGADYWVVQGTTGESATTTQEEKRQVLDFVREHNPSNRPIVFGAGGNNTAGVVSSIKSINLEGIEAILSVSPYYNKPSQEGIYHHYMQIADASPVPVIIYNVPGRTSSNILSSTTLRMAGHENIRGIKEASGDLVQCMEIMNGKPDDFMLISGDDLLTLPMLSIGASGVISVLANAYPDIFVAMIRQGKENNYSDALTEISKLLSINTLMYSESNPVGIKQVLQELGICDNYVRSPLVPASEDLSRSIRKEVEKIKGSSLN